ncbi:MAG: transketolase [Bacteroidales bacterium]|nr:transketolase [Bacteroidales bacterium]
MANIAELKMIATQVRRDILRMVHSVQSGHPGGSLGCTEFFVALYYELMNYSSKEFRMEGKKEDVFFLSNGHISPVWYSVLARRGFFNIDELKTFRKINSRLQGHPATAEGIPGVRVSSGSLGQGMSVAIGMALAKQLDNDPGIVYSLHGDGEMEEGQIWEAAMFAPARKVDNLISVVDFNGQQIDGPVNEVMPLGNLKAKFEAFDWNVLEMNGNDMEEVLKTMQYARTQTGKGKPIFIIMKTEMGYGVDFMTGTHKWHGVAPNDEQLEDALSQLPETLGDY